MDGHDRVDAGDESVDDESGSASRIGTVGPGVIARRHRLCIVRGLWSIYLRRAWHARRRRVRAIEASRQIGASRPSLSRRTRSQRDASSGSCVTMTTAAVTSSREIHEHPEHAARGIPIEVTGRLVGQHASRLRHDGARNRGALPLATRKLPRMMQHPLRETHCRECLSCSLPGVTQIASANCQRHRDVVERGEFGQ